MSLLLANTQLASRSFLKWPGGKFRIIDKIQQALPEGKLLVEPFVGGAAVFLNTNYEKYILNDANADLITLYKTLQEHGNEFIKYCHSFFNAKNNKSIQYYRFRNKFNSTDDIEEKSALFLYLNRHGYNGLCRYNRGKGEFNVPFGRYVKPYFPEKEMMFFYKKSKKAKFVCEDFKKTMQRAKKGHIIYCDPPYVPLTETANFTAYQPNGFNLEEQKQLALIAENLSDKGIPVLLSNHSTAFTKKIYKGASFTEFQVSRFISCKAAKRRKVKELLALYQ